MHASCREEEEVALMRFVSSDDVSHRVHALHLIGQQVLIFVGSDRLLHASIDLCTWVALDDIPHLSLAGTAMALACQFIIRVNLNAEILT